MDQSNFHSLKDFKSISFQDMSHIHMLEIVTLIVRERREQQSDMETNMTLQEITKWLQE